MEEEIKKVRVGLKEALPEGVVYSWSCPLCNRKIRSLYYNQIVALVASHIAKHEKVSQVGKRQKRLFDGKIDGNT